MLVVVFSVLPEMISIFCWLLALEVCQSNSEGWWSNSGLGLSCLYLFLWIGMMIAFFHKAGTVPFFHESLKSSRSVFLAAGPKCLIMSFVTPSDLGAFLHFNWIIAASVSFMVMGWFVKLSYVGCFCCRFSCSLTWLILSLDNLTLLSSWYSSARQLAASFWAISFPSDWRTGCAFIRLSPVSSLVSFHNLYECISMLRESIVSCQSGQVCWSLSGKFCFGFVVGSCVFICWAGFHLLSESADSTMEFLQLCIPAWDAVSPPPSGNCFLAVLKMAPVNRFTFSFRWCRFIFKFLQFSPAFLGNSGQYALLWCHLGHTFLPACCRYCLIARSTGLWSLLPSCCSRWCLVVLATSSVAVAMSGQLVVHQALE